MEQEDLFFSEDLKHRGTQAALCLLARKPDVVYLSKWTALLAKPKVHDETSGASVIIFRLNQEWLAINTHVFSEVLPSKKVHRIPHRSDPILRGVVNHQGMLKLCINMHHFLSIDYKKSSELSSHDQFQRMVSIRKDKDLWIFSVDEIEGVFHTDIHKMHSVPVTVSKSETGYLRGMINWEGKNIGYIDEELLFCGLNRRLL
jgi:chemotaxis-related protein WspD